MEKLTVSSSHTPAPLELGGAAIDPSLGDTARLIVQGIDQPGIVSRIANTMVEFGANIASLNQYTSDPEGADFSSGQFSPCPT